MNPYGVENVVEILVDLFAVEMQNYPSVGSQPVIPPLRVVGVLVVVGHAVDFKNQSVGATRKVNDVWPDRFLAPEPDA